MKLINSWGNTSNKYIKLSNSLKSPTLTIGNNNSYGDVSMPLGSNSYLPSPSPKSNYLNPFSSIEDLMYKNTITFFGVPGKSNVTIGGAIASDVHGKDCSWGGSFIKNIKSLNLVLANGDSINCSREKNSEIFFTTIGGYGLTGSITGVELNNNLIRLTEKYCSNLKKGSGFESLLNNFTNEKNEYSVAWVDLLNKERNWVFETSAPKKEESKSKVIQTKDAFEPGLSLPFIGRNVLQSMSYVNKIYYKLAKEGSAVKDRGKVLYPLSFVSNTKNISKKRKIIQIQFSLPKKNEKHIDDLIDVLIYKQVPLLCSLKKLSNNETELNLSFIQEGWTIAVDFSYINFNFESIRFFYKKLISLEGKIYLAKDSSLKSEEFREMYQNFHSWSKIIKKIDPNNMFQSQMSKRLELKNW
tara:strand:+ start:2844 stop:4082 length:1239 start_codon:yes stop_codon:yes gene_type:complete